jgi:hypothetical protein
LPNQHPAEQIQERQSKDEQGTHPANIENSAPLSPLPATELQVEGKQQRERPKTL